jgi:hypothetical protein
MNSAIWMSEKGAGGGGGGRSQRRRFSVKRNAEMGTQGMGHGLRAKSCVRMVRSPAPYPLPLLQPLRTHAPVGTRP